jgi:dTDP-4-dehydrorhamnose reductase
VNILVFGGHGQLGKEFVQTLSFGDYHFIAPSVDVTNFYDVVAIFEKFKPDVVINCVAYTKVDKAEVEQEKAFKANLEVPIILSMLSKRLIHFSTDYVFDGKKGSLYEETDETNPLNRYGKSKLLGEKSVLRNKDNLVIRLSWVFGQGYQNYIKKILHWSEKESLLKASFDEVSSPTSTRSIVEATLIAIDKELSGLYHFCNSGYCSRFDWAKFIFKELKINKEVVPVKASSFCLMAQRPKFSAMNTEKISRDLGIKIPDWQSEVKQFLYDNSN